MTIPSDLARTFGIHRSVAVGLEPVAEYLANASGYCEGMSPDFARGVAWAIGTLHDLRREALPSSCPAPQGGKSQ